MRRERQPRKRANLAAHQIPDVLDHRRPGPIDPAISRCRKIRRRPARAIAGVRRDVVHLGNRYAEMRVADSPAGIGEVDEIGRIRMVRGVRGEQIDRLAGDDEAIERNLDAAEAECQRLQTVQIERKKR